ncbi:hypothetical protein [Zobellia galactanivorans]|uniref:Hypothetical membrane protein n=1 Tax=Zobellia galactanivorans (strain DSM 12802 / CCUG 47099 / CIP 106680 / NCIMB 13871 / Dsij) TaxID=63186 RepID=G0LCD3_ZOBGA|nr:hypothetical protein [Zobellia galactanivorans]CAZ96845.1 Hypothetical membrane protein [Zobellia galactanivorans]
MVGTILKYEDFFNDPIPTDKFELIKHIPRVELIASFSSINHILKKPLDLDFNYSFENQIKIITTLYHIHEEPRGIDYCRAFIEKFKEHFDAYGGGVTLSTRTSCLYALNEILFCDTLEFENKPGIKFYPDDYLAIFKFLLLCNQEMLAYNESYENEITSDKLGKEFFEAFMFKEIPSNQYSYVQNPINLLERGRQLFEYLKGTYKLELKDFTSEYKLNSPEHFLSIVANHFVFNSGLDFIQAYRVKKSDKLAIERLNALSKRGLGRANTGIQKFEFLEIKKSPLYCVESEETNIYILLDNTFLIEKSYELFFWDFYFEMLSKKGISIKKWGGDVGLFFEEYAKGIFEYCFKDHKDIILKSTKQLLIDGTEYADYYIRRKRNVVLVQAKRSYVPQVDYKEVYSLKDFNELDKDEFYKRFGLNQIVEMSIKKFDDYASIIDPSLPTNKLFIYPVLLINEPIISFAVTTYIFNKKFEQMLARKGIEQENTKWRINRLVVLHVSELERLQESLNKRKIKLDQFLQGYSDSTNVNLTQNKYAPFLTLDQYIKRKITASAIPEYLLNKEEGIFKQILDFGKLSNNLN